MAAPPTLSSSNCHMAPSAHTADGKEGKNVATSSKRGCFASLPDRRYTELCAGIEQIGSPPAKDEEVKSSFPPGDHQRGHVLLFHKYHNPNNMGHSHITPPYHPFIAWLLRVLNQTFPTSFRRKGPQKALLVRPPLLCCPSDSRFVRPSRLQDGPQFLTAFRRLIKVAINRGESCDGFWRHNREQGNSSRERCLRPRAPYARPGHKYYRGKEDEGASRRTSAG